MRYSNAPPIGPSLQVYPEHRLELSGFETKGRKASIYFAEFTINAPMPS